MPWTGEPNAGSSPGSDVAAPRADAASGTWPRAGDRSVLSCHRRLATRRSLGLLRTGTFRRVPDESASAWIRGLGEVLVVVNFAPRPVGVTLGADAGSGSWVRVAGTHREPGPPIEAERRLSVRPLEAVIATRRG
jgi:hypothetical protein